MDKREKSGGIPDPRMANLPLARWLQTILAMPSVRLRPDTTSPLDDVANAASAYHLPYFQQLPDFALALLKNDDQAVLYYAPLVYHLIGCAVCHNAYLEIYDAMSAAMAADSEQKVPADNGHHTLALTPARMLVYLCQLLINQAQAALQVARHEHGNNDAWARALLQQSLTMSSHIMQSALRQRALQNLMEVALLAAGESEDESPATHTYSSLVGAGSGARAGKTRRRAEMLERSSGEPTIELQSGTLQGSVMQHDDMLELHLQNLDEPLRGHYLQVAVPLGSLIEPVRWFGGNPRAIRSQSPVDDEGNLTMQLGKTDLRLTTAEDRNLLEAMFKKLDVRPVEM